MKKLKIILGFLVALIAGSPCFAQDIVKVTGKVISPYKNAPIIGAIVTASDAIESTKTDSTGYFSFELPASTGLIEVWAPGYYNSIKPVLKDEMVFMLVPKDKFNYNEDLVLPFTGGKLNTKSTAVTNINKENFSQGSLFIDDVLHSAIPGLQVIKGSGMPGEGSFMNSRGLNTMIGNSSPLIVVDGVPYMPDRNESPIIGGYSDNIFNAFSSSDIKNISFLKGADAAIYGSLGSNGVIMIQTDDATDFETRVSFISQFGVSDIANTMPVLNVQDYKHYVGNVALTHFQDMGDILVEFPFLKDDPDYYYNFLYNNNTDWQNEIRKPAFETENILKIKGGDAIAKYDLSFGYLNQAGVIQNSGLSRYNMRLNSNINISKKLDLFTAMSFAYLTNDLHEQGIIPETNPILASIAKSPLVSPYRKDEYNNQLPDYSSIRDEDGNIRVNNAVSNPLALVNTTKVSSKGSDVMMNGGINYKLSKEFKLTGMIGLYKKFSRSALFVPGISSGAIMPLEDGLANNTVREGIREVFNMYYNLNASFNKTFNHLHRVKAVAGWQVITTRKEFDAGTGRNTSSDFYKTLDNVNSIGRSFYGYIDKWNWMNSFAKFSYTYNNLYELGLNVSVDRASSTGSNASQYGVFPGVNAAVFLHNLPVFENSSSINRLILRGEYVLTGNSNFGSNISDYYYRNQVFSQLSGIVRANIPNTGLKWENNKTINLGIDLSAFKNNLDVTIDVYNRLASDVILAKDISSAFGMDFTYDNMAEIQNQGIELGIQTYLINRRDFKFLLGGTIATNTNKVKSLGGESDKIIEFNDGSALITREGEAVYSFYGYKTDGVYATTAEANAANLTDYAGNKFQAGDVRFVNVNNSDHQIDRDDRVILGNPNPDFFGNFYTMIKMNRLALTANFSFSYGNQAYNALRKEFESMDDFGNQLVSVNRRWQTEGQVTDMPRAVYGDPIENARFSDRWIEDASYLKLKVLTISYDLKEGDLGILKGGQIYINGENLFTFTNYLGLDPEFSYSYLPYKQGIDFGKVPQVRTVKLGFKLQF